MRRSWERPSSSSKCAMELNHIGIVVKDIDQELSFWERTFGYRAKTRKVTNTRQKVHVIFLGKPGSIDIKLIEPTGEDSSVYRAAQRGGGLHHLCFKCDHVDTRVAELQENGLRLLAPPQPGEAFDNELIAFLMGGNCVNFEVIDTEKRAATIDQ